MCLSIPCLPLASSCVVNAGKILQLPEPSTSRATLRINVFMFYIECLGNKDVSFRTGWSIFLYDRDHQKCNEISEISLLSGCICSFMECPGCISESRSLSVSHTVADDYSQ